MKAPTYWKRNQGGLISNLLSPVGWLYGVGAQMNQSCLLYTSPSPRD